MEIQKILTKNDTGQTGSHQSGFAIPKRFLSFFPKLPSDIKNPRLPIKFIDEYDSNIWEFDFVHYNNIYWLGTRNEFRILKISSFIKKYNLKHLDTVIFKKIEGQYLISFVKNIDVVDAIEIDALWSSV